MDKAKGDKESILGEILEKTRKLAFEYRLTAGDTIEWLRDGGYRDKIYKLLNKLTLPELKEGDWSEDRLSDLIEWATQLTHGIKNSTGQPPIDRVSTSAEPTYIWPSDTLTSGEEFLDRYAKRERIKAEADLLNEIRDDIRSRRYGLP